MSLFSTDIVQISFPEELLAYELDQYLADGWFRSSLYLYRMQVHCIDEDIYSVINIRSNLRNYVFSKSLRKLLRKNTGQFQVTIAPLELDEEKDRLYQNHKSHFKGFIYPDFKSYLTSNGTSYIFNSWEVCVRNQQGELIAFSIFDLGEQSIASIIGLYNEEYARFSPGLFTMLLEVQFALDNGFTYYYPGYIFDNSPVFDYKLRIGQVEFHDWEQQWLPFEQLDKKSLTGVKIKGRIREVEDLLQQSSLYYRRYLNPLFSFGYMNAFEGFKFLRSVLFLSFENRMPFSTHLILEYLPEPDMFYIREASPFVLAPLLNLPTSEYENSKEYFMEPLCINKTLLETQNPLEVVAYLLRGKA